MTIKDRDERSFYEIESRQADWDVRELKRQKASCLYNRLALSRDKEGIWRLAKEGQVIVRPEDLLKEPLVLEFLGLEDHPNDDREVKLPEETPPSASSSANPPKRPSSNSPSPDANIHAREYSLYPPLQRTAKTKAGRMESALETR